MVPVMQLHALRADALHFRALALDFSNTRDGRNLRKWARRLAYAARQVSYGALGEPS